jgi:hypothetical protein
MIPLEWALTIIGPALAIAAFSYSLFGDTYFFSFAENVNIGAICGYVALSTINSLMQNPGKQLGAGQWWLIIPLLIGFLAFARLTSYRWLARYPVALLSAVGVGVVISTTIRSDILPAITATTTDIIARVPDPASTWIILLGVLAVSTYFLYSRRISGPFYSEHSRLRWVVRIGRIFMMVGFGVLYARIFVGEGTDSFVLLATQVIKRTIDRIVTGIF